MKIVCLRQVSEGALYTLWKFPVLQPCNCAFEFLFQNEIAVFVFIDEFNFSYRVTTAVLESYQFMAVAKRDSKDQEGKKKE